MKKIEWTKIERNGNRKEKRSFPYSEMLEVPLVGSSVDCGTRVKEL